MLTDKLLTLAFGLLFLFMIACGESPKTEQAKTDTPPVVKEMSRSAAFLDYAASTTMLQAELARLATERSESEEVKALSTEMLDFYSHALKQLQQVARAEGLHNSLPDSLGSADRATVEEFGKLTGAAFDERYKAYVYTSQQSQLDHYQETLLRAEEEEIRNWVNEMQLQLRARLQLAAQYDSAR
ncbi:DUF4142 domain-containing protein [Pontibacter amylolyticus]|uniref:DUF4142 domain-containing protein n=1 Tax=Pontibacter amylolyticus TaxID=1424080 RepID=A0ABQ1VZS6_9BACT|nr:DUF4142 domain-containing protein [Pontibacter amylolyticus]GGG07783.1 hypothetical protein GCM10011323_10440 [Pontibacter amylolyticus]